MICHSPLKSLQNYLFQNDIESIFIPKHDKFFGEYISEHDEKLAYISGFTGSSGFAVVTQKNAFLWTDGRYTLQAEKEIDNTVWDIFLMGDTSLSDILKREKIKSFSFDSWLVTFSQYKKWSNTFEGIKLVSLIKDPFQDLWKSRPNKKQEKIFIHEMCYAGQSSKDKIEQIQKNITHPHLVTQPDHICWLLNIRGRDVEFSPIVHSYGIIHPKGKIDLFLNRENVTKEIENTLQNVANIYDFEAVISHIQKYKVIEVDYELTSVAFAHEAENVEFINRNDPLALLQSIKNTHEQSGIKNAHIADGIAVTKALYWIDSTLDKKDISELDIVDKLLKLRQENELFLYPSFSTIAGAGPNGAVIHYRPEKKTNLNLDPSNQLILIDSGGQYLNGTTDITRTLALTTPSKEVINRYTEVLKGHIALSDATFPKGTPGQHLDILARQFLWKNGLDYKHGTGHGVGCFLNVHEGPQRISKGGKLIPLEPGMIVSNEPGYYKDHHFGIRLENLELVTESCHEGFLKFETLTLIPFEEALIDFAQLSPSDFVWLKNYYQKIRMFVYPKLSENEQIWFNKKMKIIDNL